MKRIFTVMSLTVMLLALAVPNASAAGIEIPIDTVVRTAPGTLTQLADVATPPELVGFECAGLAVAANQNSVHPGNNLIIETGGTSVKMLDVEGAPNGVTTAEGVITLGERVVVTLEMGPDGVFSGGFAIVIDVNCTAAPTPVIEIEKMANPEIYLNNTGEFSIKVTNPGPVDLHDVHVTDDYAIGIDPASDCPTTIGDLAVGESFTYECTIGGLDGVSTYDNSATAIGTGPRGIIVTAIDNAVIVPEVLATTLTTPPTTQAPATTQAPGTTQAPATTEAPGETLPVTGISGGQAEGFGMAGLALLVAGIVLLGGAALVGQSKTE
ncbi:MAG: hypothetical protein M3132_06475 [Actinomycetia bacterium]|nr:hypothetical protein [Actinomycetes bacterium]